MVIDGTGAAPRKDVTVVIGGGRGISHGTRTGGASVKPAPGTRGHRCHWTISDPRPVGHALPSGCFKGSTLTLAANGITGIREMYSQIPIATLKRWRTRPENPRIAVAGFLDGPLLRYFRFNARRICSRERRMKPGLAVASAGGSGPGLSEGLQQPAAFEAYFAIAEESKTTRHSVRRSRARSR